MLNDLTEWDRVLLSNMNIKLKLCDILFYGAED